MMQSNRILRLMAICFIGFTSLAHAAVLTVEAIDIKGKNIRGEAYEKGEMTKPLVKAIRPADKVVAQKINHRLLSDINDISDERQNFSISRNDDRILTLAIDAEGCGAYCENYTTYYSFDLKDGSLLNAANLFTSAGVRGLSARLLKEQISSYTQQLRMLSKELKTAQNKSMRMTQQEAVTDLEDRIALNQECLERVRSEALGAKSGQGVTRFFTFGEFEISAKSFNLIAPRCSNHASRALDDVGNVTLNLPYAELAPWLSAYGKAVLLNEGLASPAERIFDQLLRGTLAEKTRITMFLKKYEEDSVSGYYFYDKFRTPIALSGTLRGDILELKEQLQDKSEPNATLRLTIKGDALSGQWRNAATQKQYDILLAP